MHTAELDMPSTVLVAEVFKDCIETMSLDCSYGNLCTCNRLEGLLPPAVEPIELQAERYAAAYSMHALAETRTA